MVPARFSVIAAALLLAHGAAASANGDALTIYSSAQPGALSPELYRHGSRPQAVPGYAVVRHQRELTLERGRNLLRFSDVRH